MTSPASGFLILVQDNASNGRFVLEVWNLYTSHVTAMDIACQRTADDKYPRKVVSWPEEKELALISCG